MALEGPDNPYHTAGTLYRGDLRATLIAFHQGYDSIGIHTQPKYLWLPTNPQPEPVQISIDIRPHESLENLLQLRAFCTSHSRPGA